jgi:hypothetical protein
VFVRIFCTGPTPKMDLRRGAASTRLRECCSLKEDCRPHR